VLVDFRLARSRHPPTRLDLIETVNQHGASLGERVFNGTVLDHDDVSRRRFGGERDRGSCQDDREESRGIKNGVVFHVR